MEVHPGMSFYNDVQDASDLVTKTLESANHLTPLHIPPGPVISPERYEELRETFQLCKPVMKGGQESPAYQLMFPESHRKYEPPYKFNHEHHCYDNVKDAPQRLPDLTENSVQCIKDAKNKTSGTYLVENRYRPFHPYIHGSTDIKGNLQRNKGADGPFNINGEVRGQHGSYMISQFAEENGTSYDPNASSTESSKLAVKPPELDISYRAANMLENVKKALWLTTYKRDYTDTGSMNPLLLDDYDAKIIGRATGELGKDVELRESFPSVTTQVRPLEGRIARELQGRPCHISDSNPQHQDSSDVHGPPLHCINNLVVWNNSKTSPGAFQQDLGVDRWAMRRREYLLQDQIQPQIAYQGEISQLKTPPQNKYRKITDTWKTDKLYQRQLAVPPEPEPLLKTADSIYYEDLPPSRLNAYIVWHHPVILSKPGPKNVCFRKPMDKQDPSLASDLKVIPVIPSLPGWIPNCGVARPQTKLLDIQYSFSKGDAIKRLSDLTRGGVRDLRDHDREGKRHKFQGTHSYYYH
ncbi:uncharacterized protein C7orf31 homolog [Sceloporus undulatus]|uniref:uncharacterized protein C7orf31 homolog n=1 Tax=Sceloporus undulatus TaxID=8520 RepID=UPI001C4CEA52|nr:uncharacterized protein C7orf31 homolog [Sceloporus undulatus]